MRLFYLLFLLTIPTLSFSQDCTEASIPAAGGTINCQSLTISNDFTFTPDPNAAALFINVTVPGGTGNVDIKADFIIDGANGITSTVDTNNGGSGGPGASEGGGINTGTTISGNESFLTLAPDGLTPVDEPVCDHGGGGGGGVSSPGQDGFACPPGTTPGTGGFTFSFPVLIQGAYGGGAGGAIALGGPNYDVGTGGGGGGGVHIVASGKITISNGVRISARGGRGGNSVNLGGAGGGGAGGIIWLETPFPISNAGIFDVRGGDGGINTASSQGGHGGRGGNGIFRFEVAGIPVDGTGLTSFAAGSSLKSDIACGTIVKPNEKQNLLLQMMMGFALALSLGLISKKKKS